MPKWIHNSPTDRQQVRRQAFSGMVSNIPVVRGWFGLSARRVEELPGGKVQAKSISSSLFLAFSVAVGDWVQAVMETRQSMYLDPPIPKGDRWVEHLRNTYRDYGMDLDSLNWERSPEETVAQYEARLESYAQNLIDVFRKQSVTKDAIVAGLARILPAGATVEVVEPYTFAKPYPGPRQYQINRLPGETDLDYQQRLVAYDAVYQQRRLMARKDATGKPNLGAMPNTMYPVPADSPVQIGTFDEQSQGVLSKRLSLLKSDLGSYTNLDGTYTRRYFSERNQGGRLEITLSEDLTGAYDRLKALKAAGVDLTLYVKQFLGTAPSTANQSPVLHEPAMDAEGVGIVIAASDRPIVVVQLDQ